MTTNNLELMHTIYVNSGIDGLNAWMDMNDVGDMTLEEIGKVLGITRERVRQIERSALKKLKHPKVGRAMKQYFNYGDGDSNLRFHGGDK